MIYFYSSSNIMTSYTISDNSGIPDEYKKYFQKVDMTEQHYISSGISITIWGLICIYIYKKLILSEGGLDNQPDFIIVYFTCIMLPFTIFIYKIYNIFHRIKVNERPLVPPDYGVCFRPWLNLSEVEKRAGVIGAIDMKCNKMNQSNYAFASSREIQNNTYYLIYTMLTLTLLFFPLPEDYPFNRDSRFVKALIKVNILLCLVLLSSPIFMGRVESSNFSMYHWYTNLMIMTADVILMLITFIIYKVLRKGNPN